MFQKILKPGTTTGFPVAACEKKHMAMEAVVTAGTLSLCWLWKLRDLLVHQPWSYQA